MRLRRRIRRRTEEKNEIKKKDSKEEEGEEKNKIQKKDSKGGLVNIEGMNIEDKKIRNREEKRRISIGGKRRIRLSIKRIRKR